MYSTGNPSAPSPFFKSLIDHYSLHISITNPIHYLTIGYTEEVISMTDHTKQASAIYSSGMGVRRGP